MVDPIQIPNRTPQPYSPTPPPYDFANAYLNRQMQYAQAPQEAMGQALDNYYKEMELKAGAFKAGGPMLMNQLYGNGQSAANPPPNYPQTGDSNQNPSPTSQMNPQAGAGAATISPGQPMAAGANNVGQDVQTPQQPGQPMMHPQSGLPQTIHDHLTANGVHPDSHGQVLSGMGIGQTQTQPQATPGNPNMGVHAQNIQQIQAQMAQNAQMGDYGAELNKSLSERLAGEKALMEGEQFNVSQGAEQNRFETGQAAEQERFEEGQNLKRGQSSADAQGKYNTPETKIQAATLKLQRLQDAYNKVPDNLKGSAAGAIPSQVGSVGGKLAPELVTYNKLREAAAVTLAIARNPENMRPSPQDIQDELKNLPSVGDDPRVAANLFGSTADDLKDMHTINTQAAQSSAHAFGGKIVPGQTPRLNAKSPKQPGQKAPPQVGQAYKGYIYKGGDPSNQNSWQKQ